MVALKTERRVFMWRVVPRPSPSEAPVAVTMGEILGVLESSYAAGKAQLHFSEDGRPIDPEKPSGKSDPKNRLYVADFREDAKRAVFLINRGDPELANTGFIDHESDEVRTIPPREPESQGYSAHLVVAKKQTDGFHRSCFERMPNVSSSRVSLLIKTILDAHAKTDPKYSYKKAVKQGKKYVEEARPYRPLFAIEKVPSESIQKDVKRGEITGITLIDSHPKFSGVDAPDVINSVKSKLIIRPKKVGDDKILGFIKSIAPWAKSKGFNEIQIEVRNLPGNASSTPRFNLDKEDALETLYVRTQRLLGFGVMLDTVYGKISDEIVAKMTELIDDDSKW